MNNKNVVQSYQKVVAATPKVFPKVRNVQIGVIAVAQSMTYILCYIPCLNITIYQTKQKYKVHLGVLYSV